ncbi:hypothetical protein IE53DRAFT_259984 [Violaceomyces palustris]|uniref:Uncharacterized protein n=1 Tax=Violaceomyces palustris TaxID=1673888 RepID=A0ACD0NN82_9BASI|nr:hypothetical protein IE53DRAFT_259984 [Violaceomyces palustris]
MKGNPGSVRSSNFLTPPISPSLPLSFHSLSTRLDSIFYLLSVFDFSCRSGWGQLWFSCQGFYVRRSLVHNRRLERGGRFRRCGTPSTFAHGFRTLRGTLGWTASPSLPPSLSLSEIPRYFFPPTTTTRRWAARSTDPRWRNSCSCTAQRATTRARSFPREKDRSLSSIHVCFTVVEQHPMAKR